MTLDQAMAFGIIGCTIGLFLWGRLPFDLVALMSLLAGVLTGVVPAAHAFEGLGDDVVVIIGAALIVSVAIDRSGVIEALMRPILPRLGTEQRQVPVLVAAVTLLSMVSKNVGALAIFIPVAMQLARRTGTAASRLLMPMAFGSLVGGLVTLIGTSPQHPHLQGADGHPGPRLPHVLVRARRPGHRRHRHSLPELRLSPAAARASWRARHGGGAAGGRLCGRGADVARKPDDRPHGCRTRSVRRGRGHRLRHRARAGRPLSADPADRASRRRHRDARGWA